MADRFETTEDRHDDQSSPTFIPDLTFSELRTVLSEETARSMATNTISLFPRLVVGSADPEEFTRDHRHAETMKNRIADINPEEKPMLTDLTKIREAIKLSEGSTRKTDSKAGDVDQEPTNTEVEGEKIQDFKSKPLKDVKSVGQSTTTHQAPQEKLELKNFMDGLTVAKPLGQPALKESEQGPAEDAEGKQPATDFKWKVFQDQSKSRSYAHLSPEQIEILKRLVDWKK